MMKKQYLILYVIVFSLLISLQFSCQKWLDVRPGGQVVTTELFQDENGFKEALNGVYVRMGAGLYADTMTMGVWSSMAQDYNIYTDDHPYYACSQFNYNNSLVRKYLDGIWSKMYKAVGEVNVILEQIDKQEHVFTGDNYARFKGQALGIRAFLHFDLLRMYGPVPINSQTQSSIPYVKVFSKEVTPLNTFEQVIQLCLADLDASENLLATDKELHYDSPNPFDSYTRNHFNFWAAKALKARVYLYAGDKVNALRYAKEIIDAKVFPFVERSQIIASYNKDKTFTSEHIFALYSPKMSTYVDYHFRLERTASFYSRSLFGDSYLVEEKFEIYEGGSTDYRWLHNIKEYDNLMYSTKFYQDNLTFMRIRNQMPLIRLSEMYYIAAEATEDPALSREYINTVRSKRGLSELADTWDEETKSEEIAKEYNKEFFVEGQFLFYLKRLGIFSIPGFYGQLTAQSFRFPYPVEEIEFGNR